MATGGSGEGPGGEDSNPFRRRKLIGFGPIFPFQLLPVAGGLWYE